MGIKGLREPVLVTGATGYIGQRVVARLTDAGVEVRAFVLPLEPPPPEWGDAVQIWQGDVTDRASVTRAAKGAGTVVHLAAVVGDWGGSELHQRVTVGGTENVLAEAARQRARAVLVSSVTVYGDRIDPDVCDEDHPFGRPVGNYSRSKQAQEVIARRLEREQDLQVSIVRPGDVYGPGSPLWVDIPIQQMKKGMPVLIDGGRKNAGLAYVENVADLLVKAASLDAAVGRAYNANDGSDVTWRRYFTDLARLSGAPRPRSAKRWIADLLATSSEWIWDTFRRQDRPLITHEALNLVGSDHKVPIDRARKELGYEPAVDYDAAMKAIAAYLGGR